jgi:hypothetical protein
MKKILLPIIVILLAGCDYEVPLCQTPSAPANTALAGTWAGKSTDEKPVSLEIKTSGTDYNVIYTEGSDALAFKGFEIKVAGLNLIQLELQNSEKQKYFFAKYALTAEGLSVYRLNTEVISAKCQTTEELLKDIDVHRNNQFLFSEPLKFTKSAQQ